MFRSLVFVSFILGVSHCAKLVLSSAGLLPHSLPALEIASAIMFFFIYARYRIRFERRLYELAIIHRL